MQLISRQEAKAQGLTRFFTGLACLRGHVSERRVTTGACCACRTENAQTPEAKAKQAAYRQTPEAKAKQAAYGQTPERKAKQAAYEQTPEAKAKKAARNQKPERKAQKAVHYAANSERIKARVAANYKANPEKIAAYRKANAEKLRAEIAAYRRANPEKIAAHHAAWRKANPASRAALGANYRAAKLERTPKWLTKADKAAIKAIYEQANFMSRVCGEPMHVDHIYPLQGETVSGLHVPLNLQILTATENLRKNNRYVPSAHACN